MNLASRPVDEVGGMCWGEIANLDPRLSLRAGLRSELVAGFNDRGRVWNAMGAYLAFEECISNRNAVV